MLPHAPPCSPHVCTVHVHYMEQWHEIPACTFMHSCQFNVLFVWMRSPPLVPMQCRCRAKRRQAHGPVPFRGRAPDGLWQYQVHTVWRSHSIQVPGARVYPLELSLQTGDCCHCPHAYRLEGDLHMGPRFWVLHLHPLGCVHTLWSCPSIWAYSTK